MSDIERRVLGIIAEQLALPAERVVPQAEFIADLGADDLDRVEIAMSIEEAFTTILPDDELEGISTVAELVALAERHVAVKQ